MGLESQVELTDANMSSRQRKRLLKGEDDLAHLRALESPEENENENITIHNKKSNKGFRGMMAGFATLDDDNGNESNSEKSEDEKVVVIAPPKATTGKKKNKKK